MAQNGYYNNPAFAQAAANLSSLFAPPSGSDAAGWAMARERQMKADQLKWLFDNYQDPSASARSALTGVQGYGSTPSGFAATDATNRFKITTDDATNRYKVEQDNARAMAQTQAEQAGQTTRMLLGPVGQGQTRFVPPGVAGAYNIPQTQVGAISVNPGERVVTPDGRTIEGAPKPLGTDELAASIMQGQIASGQLTPAQAIGAKLGTPVQVAGPGGKPVFMDPGTAATTGAPAYEKPTAETKPTNGLAIMKDGGKLPVTQGPDGKWRTMTGAELPPDGVAMITGMPNLTGSQLDLGIAKTTEAQDRAGYAGKMSEDATNAVVQAFDSGALPNTLDYQAFTLLRNAPAALAPAIISRMSPQGQLFYQNIRSALPYQLMAQSGQAVTEQEYERKLLELVPIPGEDPAVSQAKRRQFVAYGDAIRGMAGPAADKVGGLNFNAPPAAPVPQGASSPAPAAPVAAAPGRAGWQGQKAPAGNIPVISSPAEAAKLPSGTRFRTPDGREKVVP